MAPINGLDLVEPENPQDEDFRKLEKLFRLYGRYAFGLAIQLVSEAHLAEEITHEAFLRYFRNPCLYKLRGASFFEWLLTEVRQIYQEWLVKL